MSVSIITPTFNSERFIAETILSVQAQTYQDWEMIIIDDCSTDRTAEIVASFQEKDSRIKYFYNTTNKGSAFSRNLALQKAKGKWIAFLDSDDLWHPEKLEKQIEFMTKNNYHFSYTNYCEIDENSKETGILITGPKVITNNLMKAYCWPGCLTVMYDAEKVGIMQTVDIRINEEYALWIKIAEKLNCYLLDENLAKYRRHNNSLTSQSYFKLIKWHYLMFRKSENRNVISSFILTLVNIIFGTYKKVFYRIKY
ncbi:MAG: glycosyltransferase family 2 protein [Bacteroidales bacterium]|nr:glycosyltransferase family 2 protein [Bacteroidales bacterium]